jgi:hypothetical protein
MQPLPGIKNPLEVLGDFGLVLSPNGIWPIVLGVVFTVWLAYTLVMAYHWVRYSHAAVIGYPALFVHLVVSVACMSYALSGSPLPTV